MNKKISGVTMIGMLFLFFCLNFAHANKALARAGGGGSSSGGGFSSGGYYGSGSGTSSGLSSDPKVAIFFFAGFIVFASVMVGVSVHQRKKKLAQAKENIEKAQMLDIAWNYEDLKKHVSDIFANFQQDWSAFNLEGMRQYLSEEYYKRIWLELNVLKSEGRRNNMEKWNLLSVEIISSDDEADNSKDTFVAEINAWAKDVLFDEKSGTEIYIDNSTFTEYWDFVRQGNDWKLDLISQSTESKKLHENEIESFAQRNGFYYDPDFGWLMMPNKGVIFSDTNFTSSDINNHVIGYYRNKIIEIYTYVPSVRSKGKNYLVAQAIMPKTYNDILVRRKNSLFDFAPRSLERVHTESNDFDDKFALWADKNDQVNSFELLTPNFMEKIYALPFELNIEVVGNFLYLYVEGRENVNYDSMLEVLSWAFDEMER